MVRSANASKTAARLAARSTQLWKQLGDLWGVEIPFERPGAIWIGMRHNSWRDLASQMAENKIEFHALGHAEARELTQGQLRLDPEESYYFEPDVLQLEAAEILHAMQSALLKNKVDVKEHTSAEGLSRAADGAIDGVVTNRGNFHCDFVVNAAGGWSAALFAPLGIQVPVALEPVYAANWLISARDLPEKLPIVADFVNRAYFRRWRGSILHMHQPRQRRADRIAAAFGHSMMSPIGADVIYDAGNFAVTYAQLTHYADKVRDRFPAVGAPIYAGGYVSYFDITPDLKFILGADSKISNLFHCLGAGQALKYAPVFGDLISDLVLGRAGDFDLEEFSIMRFTTRPLNAFLSL
ncbi:MAG: FAD-binding oxidoreductase, partial [Methylocystis sp.]|nr:FAD-binding oxidoreductase [Methylocystis sp.]